MTRKWMAVLLLVVMLFASLPVQASGIWEPGAYVNLLAEQRLATRNGPGTKYRETASFDLAGSYVKVLSRAWDHNDICWVECEVEYRGRLARVYTGLKRFACPDPSQIPVGEELLFKARAIKTVRAQYGPGPEYVSYDKLFMDKGQIVELIRIEGDYAQVDWTTSVQSYRVWVPLDAISCPDLMTYGL